MDSRDCESDSDSSNDDFYSISAGSDILTLMILWVHLIRMALMIRTPSCPQRLSVVRSEGPCFGFNELNPMSIAQYSEETGPIYDLMSNDNILRYFFLWYRRISSREFPMKPTGTLHRNLKKEVTLTRIGLTLLLRQSRRILTCTSLWVPTSFQVQICTAHKTSSWVQYKSLEQMKQNS